MTMARRALWIGVGVTGIAAMTARWLRPQVLQVVGNAPAAQIDPDDPEAAERAVRYSREREKLWVVSTAWGLGFGTVAVLSGAPAALARTVESRVPRQLRIPGFVLGWSLFEWVTSLPLGYYSGYVVERRYGLTNQTRRGWLVDVLKGLGVGVALNTPVLTGFYYIVRRFRQRWWLVVSTLALPFTTLLSGLYPVLIAPIFNKYEPLNDPELEARIRSLAEREGVHVSRVMRMDMSRQTNKANAFFAGIGRTKRIVLADTLLSRFSPDEVYTVVAHELAHQVHRDTWKLVGLAGVFTFASTWLLDRTFPAAARLMRRDGLTPDLGDVRGLPLLSLLTSVMSLLGMPLANAYVRRIERAADAYALQVTGDPAAFIGAMQQLARTNLVDPDPPAIVRTMLHSHPTIGERIRWAEAQRDVPPPRA